MKLIIEYLDLTPLPHSAEHCDHSPHEDHSPPTLQVSYAKSYDIRRNASIVGAFQYFAWLALNPTHPPLLIQEKYIGWGSYFCWPNQTLNNLFRKKDPPPLIF